jgi:hypothetical protein
MSDEHPKKYLKKPVVVEAMRFTGENYIAIGKFIGNANATLILDGSGQIKSLTIKTPKGQIDCPPGHYLIRGVKDELNTYDPEVFNLNHDELQE